MAPTQRFMAGFVVAAFSASLSTATSQASALELGVGGRVEFPHHSVMNTGATATIEYWARAAIPTPQGSLMWDRYSPSAEHKGLSLRSDGTIDYVYAGSPWQQPPSFGGAPPAPAGSFPLDGAWHHVAFVRRADGRWEVYVDGASVLAMGPGTGLGNGCWLTCDVINANTTTQVHSDSGGWQVDELRVSNDERYSGAFVPSCRFQSDGSTVMLLHFDEGAGTQVADNGIASQLGSITGSYRWVADLTATCCSPGPTTYCTAKVNSQNCLPSIGYTGWPSFTGPDDFHVTAWNVLNNKTGLLIWGLQPNAIPFYGGTLCVRQPIVRTVHQSSGGTAPVADDCSGTFDYPFTQSYMAAYTLTPSDTVHAQYWYRDPGYPIGYHVGLTQGLAFAICP